jgi:two-component system chemotaxis response regulator CheY
MPRILIVDDDLDLREVIVMVIASWIKAELIEAGSGNEAIAILDRDSATKPIDFIISDFNMPNGNGGALATYLQSKKLAIPFLLLSSDEQEKHLDLITQPNRGYLQKPFDHQELREVVQVLYRDFGSGTATAVADNDYIPVSLMTLVRIGQIKSPLFIQMNESKFVKVINAGTAFSPQVHERFIKKGVPHLYVQKADLGALLEEYRDRVFRNMYFRSMKEKTTEALNLSKSTLELIHAAAKSLSWSPELIALGNDNIKMIQNIVASETDLSSAFDWFSSGEHEVGVSTGILLTYFLTSLTKELGMTDSQDLEILSMAGFFHDMLLDDYHIRNQEKFINALSLNMAGHRKDLEKVRSHPLEAREVLNQWAHCPNGLLEVIEQHHELPDGSGFPRGLKGNQIHPLAGVFIVACEAIEMFVRCKDKLAVIEHLNSRATIFSQSPTQKPFEAALRLFAI